MAPQSYLQNFERKQFSTARPRLWGVPEGAETPGAEMGLGKWEIASCGNASRERGELVQSVEELLQKLEIAVEISGVGVELWFDSDIWKDEKAKGKTFLQFFEEIMKDQIW